MSYIEQLEQQNEELKQTLARVEKMSMRWIEHNDKFFLTCGESIEFRVAEISKVYSYQSSPVVSFTKCMWISTVYSLYHSGITDAHDSKEQAMFAVEKRVFGE